MVKYILMVLVLMLPVVGNAESKVLFNGPNWKIIQAGDDMIRMTGFLGINSVYPLNMLIQTGKYENLQLDGPGGHFRPGMILGNIIRESNIRVHVKEGDVCISACAFAAMASQDLTIEGKFALHPPYPNFDMDMELRDYISINNKGYFAMVMYMLDHGYNMDLIEAITSHSNASEYVVFDNEENLLSFRTDSPLTKTDSGDKLYIVLGEDELIEYKITHTQK